MTTGESILWNDLSRAERDAQLAEKVLGWKKVTGPSADRLWWRDPKEEEAVWEPPWFSQDLRSAWEVVEHFNGQLFSVRNRFYNELQSLFRLPSGDYPLWPHALAVLRAEHLCVAALRAQGYAVVATLPLGR